MNKPAKVEAAFAKQLEALAEAMPRLGVFQVRYYCGNHFSVELQDGRQGVGIGVMGAVKAARAQPKVRAA